MLQRETKAEIQEAAMNVLIEVLGGDDDSNVANALGAHKIEDPSLIMSLSDEEIGDLKINRSSKLSFVNGKLLMLFKKCQSFDRTYQEKQSICLGNLGAIAQPSIVPTKDPRLLPRCFCCFDDIACQWSAPRRPSVTCTDVCGNETTYRSGLCVLLHLSKGAARCF